MADASESTLVGTFASQQDAETARGWLEEQGIGPATVEDDAEGAWQVHVPGSRKEAALHELQTLEQRRRGPAL